MKKNISVAIVIMTALITGCGNNEPAETAAPTVIEDQVTVVDNEPDIEPDIEEDTNVEVEEVPETPVVTGRVNRDDYWEGDTFHLDDYAAALGYDHLKGDDEFLLQFKDSAGNVTSYVIIQIGMYSCFIKYDNLNGNNGELAFMYHGDHSGQTAYIEFDDEIWDTGDHNSIESHIDAFDHFAYDASDALDWDGLENWD